MAGVDEPVQGRLGGDGVGLSVSSLTTLTPTTRFPESAPRAERGQAALWDRPVAMIEGDHLQMIIDPDQTAQMINKLMQEWASLLGLEHDG
ncbi:hypothetical protein ACIP98_31625 [Streptomyces sp. NPDC088354]|uniref:hypothetical protein n=1 Tax=Streptomyces sp. NPDC088354 TaxID=3365856 RepID=UPI0037F58617